MAWIWCSGVALNAQAYIFLQASITWLSICHFPPRHHSFTANLNWEIRSLLFCHFVWIVPCHFCWAVSFVHSEMNTCSAWILFVFPFALLQAQTNRTQSRTCLQDTVRLTDTLPVSLARQTKSHYKLAHPDLFTRIDVERISNHPMSRLQFFSPGGVLLLRSLIQVLNTDSTFGSGFTRCLRLRGKDASLALVFVMNWNHS